MNGHRADSEIGKGTCLSVPGRPHWNVGWRPSRKRWNKRVVF